jgi:hypothetical protein
MKQGQSYKLLQLSTLKELGTFVEWVLNIKSKYTKFDNLNKTINDVQLLSIMFNILLYRWTKFTNNLWEKTMKQCWDDQFFKWANLFQINFFLKLLLMKTR